MSVTSSRRFSTSSGSTIPQSPSSSVPSTPTSKNAPISLPPSTGQLRQRKPGSMVASGTPRKVNPIRRCQSMRVPNDRNQNGSIQNGLAGGLTPQPSLRTRRSSTASLEKSKQYDSSDFVKYFQYKTNKVDPVSLVNISIVDENVEFPPRLSKSVVFTSCDCYLKLF